MSESPEGTALAVASPAAAAATSEEAPRPSRVDGSEAPDAFGSYNGFRVAQRMAIDLAKSTLVPKLYQGKPENCLVAIEFAHRTKTSVLMVMQNLYVIDGKPGWSAQALSGFVNGCGRFTPLRYEFRGEVMKPGCGCRASATDLRTNDLLQGSWITYEMAKGEGWLDKGASKWKTMPEQMLQYRAASFWARVYASDLALGMPTAHEIEDITPAVRGAASPAAQLTAALRGNPVDVVAAPVVDDEEDIRRQDEETARADAAREGQLPL